MDVGTAGAHAKESRDSRQKLSDGCSLTKSRDVRRGLGDGLTYDLSNPSVHMTRLSSDRGLR